MFKLFSFTCVMFLFLNSFSFPFSLSTLLSLFSFFSNIISCSINHFDSHQFITDSVWDIEFFLFFFVVFWGYLLTSIYSEEAFYHLSLILSSFHSVVILLCFLPSMCSFNLCEMLLSNVNFLNSWNEVRICVYI